MVAYLNKPHAPTLTWLSLLSALRCRLEVKAPKRFLSDALPKISAQRRAHERQQWEARRLVAFRSQILRQCPGSSQADAQRTALGYVAASAARLDGDLQAANLRLESTRVECTAPGMRAALRAVADAANVNAEVLALLAGVSLSAAQAALDETQEGRLTTPHRLFSAIAARLVIHPAGGRTVTRMVVLMRYPRPALAVCPVASAASSPPHQVHRPGPAGRFAWHGTGRRPPAPGNPPPRA